MKDSMAESMAVFAPNANSYRRFVSESYAPIAPIWGINNRSVSLRVPAGPPASRHVEHRICGADANLYLAVGTVLGGAAQGWRGCAGSCSPPCWFRSVRAWPSARKNNR